ncbi:MAG: prolipoprotein diacylglyceryl transferase [Candidatus Woesearchaeota archaeon]|jgi:phosphatidylglycerol:prolipoprotein diacylglycerol transferase|nr:prolipoprotein diacylglyceryl transferase [Candidatus Woesearchaeota archaeon]MDP7506443.1 prolipoprotein diacylglyceryl transferase [Candidatus Woesearchaeota archaeon]MDP7610385.1 prolipoprotein diacylglyceryl transferase [Candidatus Woesearchaeota archaeon]|tara:strand:+ start:752 stop:1528 length:777 start_codon:yes stop_codon:yes gene_type:complete
MFYHNINPILFSLGPFQIRYYGIIYVLGFVIAYFLINYIIKKKGLDITKDDVTDLLFYLLIGVILGSRLFYVLVYNPKYFLAHPLDIFAIWHGGLSFHGGFIGSIVATLIFCKKKKVSFLELGDIIVIPLSIALALGRIGNFLNGELYGRVTNLPWAVKFKGAEGFRHPSQIYESLKNLFIFSVLWTLNKKNLPKGYLFSIFILMYSSLRFFVEFVRVPDSQLGFIIFGLSMGQVLSVIMFIGGLVLLKAIKPKKDTI